MLGKSKFKQKSLYQIIELLRTSLESVEGIKSCENVFALVRKYSGGGVEILFSPSGREFWQKACLISPVLGMLLFNCQ